MKIAIASTGKTQDSNVSEAAGRAPYYLIFDKKRNLLETIKNPFSIGGGGAGHGVAKMLADKDVDIIVAGKFGPNIIQTMNDRGIKHETKTGKIDDIYSELIQ